MSNIAYFTTSPAALMRKWVAGEGSITTTTSTTTTTTCPIYNLDIYVGFFIGVNTSCDCFICPDCGNENILLEFSVDGGSSWSEYTNLNSQNNDTCTFIATETINGCSVSDYRLRIFATEPCGTPVYINAVYDDTTCGNIGDCFSNKCALLETANLVGYSSVHITVCQDCVDNCSRVCCS
jgi:hypothetical protein